EVDLEAVTRLTHGLESRAYPSDITVVIRAQYVDQSLEAALALLEVVGDIRSEVRFHAVLAYDDSVLLVTKLGRAEPDSPFLLVQTALALQPLERTVDGPAVAECALGIPAIEADPELLQVVADVSEHPLERKLQHPAESIGANQLAGSVDHRVDVGILVTDRRIRGKVRKHCRGGALKPGTYLGAQLLRERQHIIPAIPVRWKRKALAALLQISQPRADGEDVHLAPG